MSETTDQTASLDNNQFGVTGPIVRESDDLVADRDLLTALPTASTTRQWRNRCPARRRGLPTGAGTGTSPHPNAGA
jgi:hypothetical protein